MFATILAVCLAYCLSSLTRKYYGASGYFQIHSRALGSKLGFTTSWLFFIYEPLNAFMTMFGFGVLVLEPFSKAYLGMTVPWWVGIIIGNIIVMLLALKNIRSSIRITAILGLVEVIIIFALGVFLLVRSPEPFHPEYFSPSNSAEGTSGLLFAFVFGFLLFMGFESGLPLTEETADIKNSTFKGFVGSVVFAGLFYIFMTYASVVGFGGGEDSVGFAKFFSKAENPYGSTLAVKAFGTIGPWLVFLAALNSTIACCLASHNAASRVFFSLGRSGVLPEWLGKVSAKTQIPFNAVIFAGIITFLATALFYGISKGGNATDWFGFMAVMMSVALLIIHLMTCISVFVVYRYRESHDFRLFHHGVLPIVTGMLVLLPLWGSVYYNLTPPMSYAPWVVGAWFLTGYAVYVFLTRTRPQKLLALESEMEILSQLQETKITPA